MSVIKRFCKTSMENTAASIKVCVPSLITPFNPSHPDPGQREKINLNFYFHTSLWYLKRFYEGLKGLHKKPFEAPQKSVKIKI